MAIDKLIKVPYSDFKLLEVIDPEQFDLNNAALVAKIDAIVDDVNAKATTITNLTNTVNTNETDIENKVTTLTNTVNANETDIENKVIALTNTVNTNETDIETKVTTLTNTVNTNEIDIEAKVSLLTTATDNDRIYNEERMDSIESTIATNKTDIEGKVSTHKTSADHDGRYFTETELQSDGSSVTPAGATKIGLKLLNFVAGFGSYSTVQAFLELLFARLRSTTDGSSGADLINATEITGLTGNTVQTIMESMKTQVDDTISDVSILDSTVQSLNTAVTTAQSGVDTNATAITALQSGKADKTAVLEKTNTTEFVPTQPYHPATKKYIDDTAIAAGAGALVDGSVTKAKLDLTLQGVVDGIAEATMSTAVETIDSIISLPSTAMNGMLEAVAKGRTRTNLLGAVGDCEDASKFSGSGTTPSVDSANKVFGSKSLKITNTTANGEHFAETIQKYSITPNKYFLISGYVKPGDSNHNATIRAVVYNGTTATRTAAASLSNNSSSFVRVGVKIQASDVENGIKVRVQLYGSSISEAIYVGAGEVANYDGIQIDEILSSEYGVGGAADQSILNKYPYINDTQSSKAFRAKSVGKNLFNPKNIIQGGYNNLTIGQVMVSNTATNRLRINPQVVTVSGKQLKIKTASTLQFTLLAADRNQALLSTSGAYASEVSYTTPTGTYYLHMLIRKPDDSIITVNDLPADIQLEVGAAATTYESYKETSSYFDWLNGEGKSLPNGVADEFDFAKGQYTKRVSDWVTLDGSKAWIAGADNTGYKEFKLTSGFADAYAAQQSSQVYGSIRTLKYNGLPLKEALSAPTEEVAIIFYSNDTLYLNVSDTETGMPEVFIATVNEIKAFFYGWKMCNSDGTTPYSGSGTKYWKSIVDGSGLTSTLPTTLAAGYTPYKMIYQLANPSVYGVEEGIQPQILTAYPSGTVFIDPAIDVVYTYTDKITFASKVKSLEHIEKIDGTAVTEIATTSATLAADGMSMTISGATAGTKYRVVALTLSESNAGISLKYSHPADRASQIDQALAALGIHEDRLDNIDKVQLSYILDFIAHTLNASNPHTVTKAQVGLGDVDNAQQATKSEFDAHTGAANPHNVTKADVGLGNVTNDQQATKTAFDAHTANALNPHTVTKAQVGLGSVDNAKQMPIAGGTFTGVAVANSNTQYSTEQLHNVIVSSNAPSGTPNNGTIWLRYKP